MLSLTQSDYGLIVELDRRSGEPELKAVALLDRSWDEATALSFRKKVVGGLDVQGSRRIFENALSSGEPVMLSNMTTVAARAGLPGGQAMLRNLLAVPLTISGKRQGLVVIANRSAGYDQKLMDYLQPLLASIAQILQAVRGDEERRRAEKASRETAERTRALVDNVVDGIILTDASGFVVEFNPAAESIYGYRAQEVVGRTIHALVPTGDVTYEQVIKECISKRDAAEHASVVRELAGVRKNGERFALELSVTPTPLGGQTMFTAVVRDITRRKRAEQALIQASEAAEAASRAKSEFLANMSHEIRTPMNGVLGMTELMLETQLDPLQKDYAHTIRDSAKSLLTVVNDILDYSKVEAGRLELERIDMDLRDVVEDVARLIALQAHAKGLEISAQVDPSLPDAVIGDPGRVRQILLNLGSNAVKFTEQGEVALSLQVEHCDAQQVVVRCTVRDTGIGIPADRLDKLFKPFSQVDSSMTRRFGGTGLGLSIARSLVELMDGQIHAESVVGKGSTFSFSAKFEVRARAVEQGTRVIATELIKGHRVLVVDDNESSRNTLAAQLRRCGMQVVTSHASVDALQRIADAHNNAQPFHFALIDKHMPGCNAEQIAGILHADPRYRTLHLVLLASIGDRGDARLFGELGFAAYLLKPATERDLIDCLALLVQPQASAGNVAIITRHQLRALREHEKQRLLLVDDNLVNRKVGKAILEQLGYRIDLACDGSEALTAWEQHDYAAILMDCQMPVMDGYEATREIRRRENGQKHVPIIAVTAHAMAGAAEECLAAGMDAYQSKPLDRALLQQCLNKFLREPAYVVEQPNTQQPAPSVANEHADAEPVDWNRLNETCDGDKEFASELIGTFTISGEQSLQQIQEALAGSDLDATQRAAHSLKGAAGSIGAMIARKVAADLEIAAKDGDTGKAALLLDVLRAEIARANEYLHRKLEAA